ncbi:MAG: hypothetical protein D3910_23700, partial [Candidatus Electrothrix sp. ATG2]|nr:hypothetical protein [Candidatus Electrothrix sp. ATG2]
VLFIVVNLVRTWSVLSNIGFYVEDAELFSHYYGKVQPLSDIVTNFSGQPYKTLITKFFAWCFAYFDVRIQPYLYLWTGFCWGICAASCFFCSGLIRSRAVLCIGPLLVGLVGMNHIFYYNTIIYIMYTCLAVLLVLLFYPAPKSIFTTFMLAIPFAIFPWAGPYSAVIIPVTLLMLLLFRQSLGKRQWLLLLSCCSAFAYYLTVQGGTSKIMRLKKMWVIRAYFDSLLDRVIFFDLFFQVSPWFWLLFLCIVGGSFFHFRKDVVFIKNSILMLAIIFSSFTLFYLSSKLPAYLYPKPCHIFISLFFWCIYLLYVVDYFFQRYGENKMVVSVFSVTVCLIILFNNRKFPETYRVPLLPTTGEYVTTIHMLEQQRFETKNQYVIVKQANYQHHFFHPEAQVGSRRVDAQQVLRSDLPDFLQNEFALPLFPFHQKTKQPICPNHPNTPTQER